MLDGRMETVKTALETFDELCRACRHYCSAASGCALHGEQCPLIGINGGKLSNDGHERGPVRGTVDSGQRWSAAALF